MCNCLMPQAKPTQAYVHTYVRMYAHTTAQLLRASLCSREENWIKVFFKDSAVPAVTVELTLATWFVLAVAMFLLILGSGGKLCSGPQTAPILPIDNHTMLLATWLGSRTFCILVYMHQSVVHDYSLHSSQFCSLLELYILF